MLKRIMWYNLAIRLRDFIKNYKTKDGSILFDYLVDRQDLKIKIGTGNLGEFPAIWILFGSEEDTNHPPDRIGGLVQLWIDVYVKGSASDEIDFDDPCYRQAYQVVQDILNLLQEYQKLLLHDYGIAAKVETQAILCDYEMGNAPVTLMNRIVVDITWYANKNCKYF